MKHFALLTACALTVGSLNGTAGTETNPYLVSFRQVAAPELPITAAHTVKEAKAKSRPEVTVNVVNAAAQINPVSCPAVVGAISRSVPDMAALAAGTAAAAQPKQAVVIARAAAAAAPKQAGNIVAAVCKVVPGEYRNVAIAVAAAAPGSNKEILSAVGKSVPELKSSIADVLTQYNGNVASVGPALDQASLASARLVQPAYTGARSPASGSGTVSRGPAIGNPYVPLPSTPTNTTPGSSGEVPTGGRNYAAP